MRCDNQHNVASGYSYCRRCDVPGGPAVAIATALETRPLLTVGGFVARRNRLMAVGGGVFVACILFAAGAVVNALVVGPFMAAAIATVLGITTELSGDVHAASAQQVRALDRLRIAPVLAVAATALVVAL